MTYPQNAIPQPQAAGTALSNRRLLSLVTTSLGGYLLLSSLTGQVTQVLSGAEYMRNLGFAFGLLLTLNLLFALAVALLGLFFATASLARRGIAAGIVTLAVILIAIFQAVRFSMGFGAATTFIAFTFADPYVMLPMAFGAAWFVVRYRPALAFVALALVVIVALAHWALLTFGADTATSSLVMLLLGATVTAAIGWGGAIASRLFGGNRAPVSAESSPTAQQYAQPQQAPAIYSQQNDRPAERGPVI
ncbi:hypothetical protein SAMN06295879_1550 [Agreia bicolorata]|uniref:Uncharacterized protein n=1 Tax=Agreia bicolorata TaxID=110935 RepID=A0A1T4XQK8_9MICO|nr:hypothetical protein [Agreia bicolorata]KJC65219.1 hypothetical protein TZ00_06800 [Agreia bicolorata]SKA91814.1 hypothetical protein SAMN06295879_1550 [Agreia bicolorata]